MCCFVCLVSATCDPSIEVISLMKTLHVLNLHWTTLYEVSVINFELSSWSVRVEWWYQWNGKFHRVIKPAPKAWVLQSLSVRGKKWQLSILVEESLFSFSFFFRGKAAEPSYLLMNLSAINSRQKLPGSCKVMFFCLRSGWNPWNTYRFLKLLTCTLFSIPIRSHYSDNWQLPCLGRRTSSKMVRFCNLQTS